MDQDKIDRLGKMIATAAPSQGPTPTPETDAEAFYVSEGATLTHHTKSKDGPYVDADFARDLECQRDALRAEIAEARRKALEDAAMVCDIERSLWKSSRTPEPDDVSGGKSAAFNCAIAIRALIDQPEGVA